VENYETLFCSSQLSQAHERIFSKFIVDTVVTHPIIRYSCPCPSHEDVRSRGIAPLIFNLCARWRRLVNFKLQPLYPRSVSHYPLNWRLCGLHSQSGIFEEADIRTPDLQARMLVTVLTTLTMWFIPKNKAITS